MVLLPVIGDLKARTCEKKLIVEVESPAEALGLCQAGVDGIQFDKVPPGVIGSSLGALRGIDSRMVFLAAGGINEGNIEEYARTGVDAVVTTSVYYGQPIDIGVTMDRL